MAELHFDNSPYQRSLFGVPPDEVEGRFRGWKRNARYLVRVTVIVQIDTTNVSDMEYGIAPNITFLSINQALVNVYQTWHFTGSFEEFNDWYAEQEANLQFYAEDLAARLNSARRQSGLPGDWYINYGLDERHIQVEKTEYEAEWSDGL